MVARKEQKYEFWTDKLAKEIVEMKKFRFTIDKVPKFKKFVVKSAASVSGVLHIGRLSDTIRVDAVHRSLIDAGYKSDFIWSADNVDPLRKIPEGVPRNYREYIGVPVTEVADPQGCHKSWEEHFVSAYLEVVHQFIQSKMKTFSMRKEYLKGHFKKEIKTILDNYQKVVEIINSHRPKDNPLRADWSPWQPICRSCGKIITTRVKKIEDGKVYYTCKDYRFKTETAVGCGHEGVDNPMKGNGKLLYRSELAAQHYHWKVRAEGFGKEYIVPGSAWWVNMEIMEKIFRFPSSIPIFYEHLLIDGKKMSASLGNIVYPHEWLQVAMPELLRLLFLKDPMRVRDFRWSNIPLMMDEYDSLEAVYFDKKKVDKRDEINMKRLFEMVRVKIKPKKYIDKPSYSTIVELLKVAPEKNPIGFVKNKIHATDGRLKLAKNWYDKYGAKAGIKIKIDERQKGAIEVLIDEIKEAHDADELQAKIFEIAQASHIKPGKFFKLLYKIILKSERGPRLGPYILEAGKEEIIKKLKSVL